jgi:hypothetical protein
MPEMKRRLATDTALIVDRRRWWQNELLSHRFLAGCRIYLSTSSMSSCSQYTKSLKLFDY